MQRAQGQCYIRRRVSIKRRGRLLEVLRKVPVAYTLDYRPCSEGDQ